MAKTTEKPNNGGVREGFKNPVRPLWVSNLMFAVFSITGVSIIVYTSLPQ